MTKNSPSDVGRTAIDAYLDSVEQALIAAHAPRGDRMQVLQDLESQISDMLAQQPSPLTEERVQSIIEKLEPPSHFAATYGYGNGKTNGKEPQESYSFRIPALTNIRWPRVAAVSCAFLPLVVLLTFFALNRPLRGPSVALLIMLPLFVGFILTPLALWNAFKQLREQSSQSQDHNLLLKSTIAYCVLVPALLMAFITIATRGYALVPFGLVAFIYLQYVLIRRLTRRMAEALPKPASPVNDSSHPGTTAPLGGAMSMPAI